MFIPVTFHFVIHERDTFWNAMHSLSSFLSDIILDSIATFDLSYISRL